jgi:hypothetical protein
MPGTAPAGPPVELRVGQCRPGSPRHSSHFKIRVRPLRPRPSRQCRTIAVEKAGMVGSVPVVGPVAEGPDSDAAATPTGRPAGRPPAARSGPSGSHRSWRCAVHGPGPGCIRVGCRDALRTPGDRARPRAGGTRALGLGGTRRNSEELAGLGLEVTLPVFVQQNVEQITDLLGLKDAHDNVVE